MIILYDSNTTLFNNLGLGILKDFKSEPEITEVLNGLYNLEFDYVKTGWLSEYLIEGNILKANNQLFRIWNIKKNTNDTKITVLAKHIWFDLEKNNFLEDVAPTKKTGTGALIWILEHANLPTNFNVSGDVSNIASARYVRMNPIEAIYTADNCLLNVFGGELELDNFNITLHSQRGKDLGLEIRQKKNLQGAECEVDLTSLATRIMPIGNNGILLPEKYIDSPLINNYHAPFFKKYEINVDVDEENDITLEDCYEIMRNEVQKLFDEGIDKPSISISIDFIELSKTKEYEEYSSLETAHLGDQCKVYIPELNINLSTRIVKTVYNCSKKRITKIELGVPKIDFISNQNKKETSFKNSLNRINPTTILEKAREDATELINHPFKGYIYISEETGEMFLMDTNDISTAKKIWKFGLGGIGYSSTGISGPYETAITSNGEIVADFITAGQIATERIEGMNELITSVNSTEIKIDDITTTTQTSTGGNNLYITDSLESNAIEYHVEGKSEQETRSGKNLLSTPYTETNKLTATATRNDYYVDTDYYAELEAGKTYTFSCETTGLFGSQNSSFKTSGYLLLDKGYTTILEMKSNPYTFTPSVSGKYYLRYDVERSGETHSFWNFYIAQENSFSGYEQYGASPSPDYPSEIKTIKGITNLFDKDNTPYINAFISSGKTITSTSNVKTYYIPCKSNTNYTLSKIVGKYCRIGSMTTIPANGTTISAVNIKDTSTNLTITTGDNDKYLVFNVYDKTADTLTEQEILDSTMIEQGTISHDYVPYGTWLKVKVTGKNLLNQNTIIKGYGLSYGETYVSNERSIVDYLKVKENVDYTAKGFTIIQVAFYNENKEVISYTPINATKTTFTTPSDTKYIRFSFDNTKDYSEMQLEEGTATENETYKEQEVLIDLSKPNLWDRDNWEIYQGSITNYGTNGFTLTKSSNRVLGFNVNLPAGQYTLKFDVENSNLSDDSKLGLNVLTSVGSSLAQVTDNSKHEITFITTSSIGKLYFFINSDQDNTATISLNNIRLYEGYNDYYELSSIGDTKNLLEIKDGEVILTKKIEKVVLNGSESWGLTTADQMFWLENIVNGTGNYAVACSNRFKNVRNYPSNYGEFAIRGNGTSLSFKMNFTILDEFITWLSENPVTVYYELAEPKQKTLSNINIPLFDGVKHISLIEDVETNTTIKYYRKTPISNDYVIQQQLDATNSDLADTTNKTNQNASDINKTNNNLNNNYYNKEQIDVINSSTEQIITQIRNEVEATTSATNLQISVLQEQLTNGVTAVKTETGYTFDKDGLKIAKSDSEMNLLLDNDGMEVKRNETEVLTVRSDGVETENLKVRTYFTVGNNTRVEDYKNGTGFFYIGGGN